MPSSVTQHDAPIRDASSKTAPISCGDRTNVKITMLIDGIIGIIATVSIVLAFTLGVPGLYILGAFCCGFCYGGVPVVASAFSRQRFGAKNYPLNLSLANFAIVWGSILNVILQAIIGTEARVAIFTVLIVLAVLAVLDVIPFSKMWNSDMKMLDRRRAEHRDPAAIEAEEKAAGMNA